MAEGAETSPDWHTLDHINKLQKFTHTSDIFCVIGHPHILALVVCDAVIADVLWQELGMRLSGS